MRPRERRESSEQDLFRSRLHQIIDMKHALVKLARAIDWGAEIPGAGQERANRHDKIAEFPHRRKRIPARPPSWRTARPFRHAADELGATDLHPARGATVPRSLM